MNEISLVELIERGGILQDVPGNTPKEVITNIIRNITLPSSLKADVLLEAVLERENLMPTSIGGGIAVPHPRNPLLTEEGKDEQFITIGYLKEPVEWQALDSIPAQSVILLVSSSARAHLHSLSRVHFICRQDSFCRLLTERASKEELVKVVAAIEKIWI
jgi:PTS system nitrogen regulatory IIA component